MKKGYFWFGYKIVAPYKLLSTCRELGYLRDDDMVMFFDAFDTILQKPTASIIDTFVKLEKNRSSSIIFSSERNPAPQSTYIINHLRNMHFTK